MTIREASMADIDAVQLLYEGLSDDDRHLRFFSAFHPDRAFFENWLRAPERGGYVVIALLAEGAGPGGATTATTEQALAEAAFTPVEGGAEFAITVAAEWRGWLGPYLLDRLVAEAGRRGIGWLQADILATNYRMLRVVSARGAVRVASGDPCVVKVRVPTTGGEEMTFDPGRSRG